MTVFALKAVATALKTYPNFNATLDTENDEIIIKQYYHIGVAVNTDDGLIVPVIRDVDRKSITELAVELNNLVIKTRERKTTVEEMQGGTFTITNLSMFEIDGITPILRPPETGILAFGRVKLKPAVHNGEIVIRSLMTVCLTFDHRVVDGAPASRFLQTLARFLEEPTLILT